MSFRERLGLSRQSPRESSIRTFPALPPKADDHAVDQAVRDIADWMKQPSPTRPTVKPIRETDQVAEYVIPPDAPASVANQVVDAFLNGEKPPEGKV